MAVYIFYSSFALSPSQVISFFYFYFAYSLRQSLLLLHISTCACISNSDCAFFFASCSFFLFCSFLIVYLVKLSWSFTGCVVRMSYYTALSIPAIYKAGIRFNELALNDRHILHNLRREVQRKNGKFYTKKNRRRRRTNLSGWITTLTERTPP